MAWCRGDILFCEKLAGRAPVADIAETLGKTVDEILERFPHAARVTPAESKESTPDNYGATFSDAEIIEVLTRRMAGVDMHDIARGLSRTYRGVQSMLVLHKLTGETRKRGPNSSVSIEDVVRLTAKGMSQREVARELGTNNVMVGRRQKQAGIVPAGGNQLSSRYS